MSWPIVVGVAVLAVCTYVSSVALSLMVVSRSALEARLAAAGREQRGVWLFGHIEPTRLARRSP